MSNSNLNEKQHEIEAYYDEYVERQLRVGVNKRHHSILEKLKKSGLQSTDHVLEIGCGIGTFTSLLIREVSSGQVVSMDISGASIRYANDHNTRANLKFIHADAANHDFGAQLFDVIVLPDVLEHIPIELHHQLFEKLAKVLKPSGFIFIHIPNPFYLDWCHINQPDILQIIDQPIHTEILLKSLVDIDLYIHELKTYSIWWEDCDYQYIVLRKKSVLSFSKQIPNEISFFDRLKAKWKLIRSKKS
jgi:trans-aconitate 2-methyltransferase